MPGPLPGGGGTGGTVLGWGKSGPPTGMPSLLGLLAGSARMGAGGLGAGYGAYDPLNRKKRPMFGGAAQGAAPKPGGGYDYQEDPFAYVSGYKGPENLLGFRDKVNKGGGDWTPERYQQVSETMKSLRGGVYGPGRGKAMGGFGETGGIMDPIKKLLMARYGGGI